MVVMMPVSVIVLVVMRVFLRVFVRVTADFHVAATKSASAISAHINSAFSEAISSSRPRRNLSLTLWRWEYC